jgi:hypothetical protein
MSSKKVIELAAKTIANADGKDWWTGADGLTREDYVRSARALDATGQLVGDEVSPEDMRMHVTDAMLDADAAFHHGDTTSPFLEVARTLSRVFVITPRS